VELINNPYKTITLTGGTGFCNEITKIPISTKSNGANVPKNLQHYNDLLKIYELFSNGFD